ncbi:MAG: Tfp pilus assembly protein FimT/FimU [Fidelibacterota bacterium]
MNYPIIGQYSNRSQLDHKSKDMGFTLIELIMVIVIMSILAAIFVPRFMDAIESLRVRNAIEKIKDDVRYIRDYAAARHDTTWLVVDPSTNSYGIYSGPSSSNRTLIVDPATNTQQMSDLTALYVDAVITSVSFGGNLEMYFDWWGTPSNGGDIVINNYRTIKIEPKSGYVYEN